MTLREFTRIISNNEDKIEMRRVYCNEPIKYILKSQLEYSGWFFWIYCFAGKSGSSGYTGWFIWVNDII